MSVHYTSPFPVIEYLNFGSFPAVAGKETPFGLDKATGDLWYYSTDLAVWSNLGGGGGGGIVSINGNVNAAQTIAAGAGITVVSAAGTTTITATGIGATLTTYLAITAFKATGSTYDVTASGADYTKSGDNGSLGVDAATFNGSEKIQVYLNGTMQHKGTDVVWQTATTFVLNQDVDLNDELIVLS